MATTETFWKDLLARLPCLLVARVPGTCAGRVHSHHVATGSGKRSPYGMVRLCHEHHEGSSGLHGMGPKAFVRAYRVPGEREEGLWVWQAEDLATFLRYRVRLP